MGKIVIKKPYVILRSKRYGAYSDVVSEKCLLDFEKEHISLKVNKGFLKSVSGKGFLTNNDIKIGYIYDLKNAFTAGAGRYLEYLIQYAGTADFTGVIVQILDNETSSLIYEVFTYRGKSKSNRIKVYVPFDSDVDIRTTKLVITRLLNDEECAAL